MPNLTKANNTTAMSLAGSWVENIAPTSTSTAGYDAIFDTTAASQSTGSIAATVFFGTVNLQTTGAPSFSVTATGAFNFNVYGPVTGGSSSYSVFVASGKTLNLPNRLLLFGSRSVQPVLNHVLYVDTGGTLCLNQPGASGNNGNVEIGPAGAIVSLRKQGPGVFYTGRSTSAPSWSTSSTGLYIDDGTVRLDGATGTTPLFTTPITFSPQNSGQNPTLEFVIGNGSFTGTTRSLPNNVVVNASGAAGGRILVSSGFTATMTGTTSGAGVLTIAGGGALVWSNDISCSLNVTGSLTVSANYNLTGSTLTGSGGTIAFSTYASQLRNDAPDFTGTVSGNFSFNGSNKTFKGNISGACDFAANSSWTFTGASSGAINAIGQNVIARVRGSFGATSGTTLMVNGGGLLAFYGTGSFHSGRIIEVSNNTGTITLQEASTGLASEVKETGASGVLTFGVEDATACTYSGNMTVNSATGATTKIRSKGTLTMSGTVSGGAAGRTISLNSDSGYAGTIKVTGAGFTASSPVTLSQGTLHLNRAGTVNMTGGLTVSNLATVACSSNGAYAAQLSGALTLNSGAIMQFGAP